MQKCLSSSSSFPGLFHRTENISKLVWYFKLTHPLWDIACYCCKKMSMITNGMFVSNYCKPLSLPCKIASAQDSHQVFAHKIQSTI